MTPTTNPCRRRRPAGNNGNLFHCNHPRVVLPGTCNSCRVRDQPLANGDGQPTAMAIPAGPRTVYPCDVVIPGYINLQCVPAAIDSIHRQQAVEPVIQLINDNSPEEDEVLRRQYANLTNLQFYRNRENMGPYASLLPQLPDNHGCRNIVQTVDWETSMYCQWSN